MPVIFQFVDVSLIDAMRDCLTGGIEPRGRVDGKDAEFFLQGTESDAQPQKPEEKKNWTLIDSTTASQWNFQGCAVSGPSLGKCLDRVPALKDYWFDWRNYHHDTSVYKR